MPVIKRRSFVKGAAAGLLSSAVKGQEEVSPNWLGPDFWANRLQDWRYYTRRIECLTGAAGDEVRTAAILTREISAHGRIARLRVRTGTIEGGPGFSGLLIGAGAGRLDYRAAALVQKASGTGGGILCVYESDGRIRFREHTSEEKPLAFAELPSEQLPGSNTPRTVDDGVTLNLEITPGSSGGFDLRLTASSLGQTLAGAILRGVAEDAVVGGIALVSSPLPGAAGARYWFRDFYATGDKIARHPERALGPILGTLYSLGNGALKMTAQFMPVPGRTAQLEYRAPGGTWRRAATAPIGPGFTAHFRVEYWEATREWQYRVRYGSDSFEGVIRKEPGKTGSLNIALLSCIMPTARPLEGGVFRPEIPGEEFLGRYTQKSLYFPHSDLVLNAGRHNPDLLVFAGDQIYETQPTRKEWGQSPTFDYLYKWYLWLWAFRDMTRATPTIVMVDDHDVYHGNIWGAGGRPAPDGDQDKGGYRCTGDFVNLVQRTQCGHNPDPFDATPVAQNISVYYGSFTYGGVSFAILEDRKFKIAPRPGARIPPGEAALLGERQEKFLAQWAKDSRNADARICLTQTAFACIQTTPDGKPALDFDSNGYPRAGRDRAIGLLGEARALVLGGDQHLASVAWHRLEAGGGVFQFCGPAGASSFQRWWEPAPLPEDGDFVDGFGNSIRVIAIANPKVSFRRYRNFKGTRGQGLGDRQLKSEGYGIVRVDRVAKEFVLECWPHDVDPKLSSARQFSGWPVRIKFDKV